MNRREIKIAYLEFDGIGELPDEYRLLIMSARKASVDAWAPYSGFKVGAAVKLLSGLVLTGNNQENAAYPAGLCAERTVLFYANANYPDDPVIAIAVTAQNAAGFLAEPVKPCGGCRQTLLEVQTRFNRPVTIILDGQQSIYMLEGVDSLLPLNFTGRSL